MKALLLATLSFLAISCSTTPDTSGGNSNGGGGEEAVVTGTDGVYDGGDGYNPGKADGYNSATNGNFYDDPNYGKNPVGGPNGPAKDRVIYFGTDSVSIDSRSQKILEAHAKYLKKHSKTKVLFEGHTDSTGSRGYNVALGERRAISVIRLVNRMGVQAKQMRIISYGEENPAVTGFSENSYKRNRRVIIQY